jgi:hypothetical protein
VLQPAVTTSDRKNDPAIQARSAASSADFQDPYIDRHAEVVALYHGGSPR